MLIKSLDKLTPRMKNLATMAIDEMKNDQKLKDFGVVDIIINESFRELSTQLVYWMRGRMNNFDDIRAAYKKAFGWHPTTEECAKKITWTLDSKHMEGNAIDLVPSRGRGDHWWTAPKEVWERMGEIGINCGLKWGGDWKGRADVPHFEV